MLGMMYLMLGMMYLMLGMMYLMLGMMYLMLGMSLLFALMIGGFFFTAFWSVLVCCSFCPENLTIWFCWSGCGNVSGAFLLGFVRPLLLVLVRVSVGILIGVESSFII
jgi:hypothetical protein